jgi:HSP20 family molecular chaperone IbpA
MWAEACDRIEQAERLHRRFFRLAASPRARAVWEPPADVFESGHEWVVVVALPGVAPEDIELTPEPGGLVVRAVRTLPFAAARLGVRQLEIPYGDFERRIALPAARFELASREHAHGCLILRLNRLD